MAFSSNFVTWRLRKGMDRRFRAGHPWVYSNELSESPKGIEPGTLVELRDSTGKFLARGYGNPQSLIAFRSLSRDPDLLVPDNPEVLLQILKKCGSLRQALGLRDVSHRLCFGEADGLPGLVVDRYALPEGQAFVVQAHTAGANRALSSILLILEQYVKFFPTKGGWEKTAVILRNDLSVRKLEGLVEEEPRVIWEGGFSPDELRNAQIRVASASGGQPLSFHVDLLGGQKTGFFLDQYANIQLAVQRLGEMGSSRIRILDLCCYVGQWGAQLACAFKRRGMEVEVVAMDASAQALALAQKNIELQGAHCETWKGNVLKDLSQAPDRSFDLVVSDPPALIKSRKDIPAGTHAYLQLATQVFRLVNEDGGVICCSCSALLEEESFSQVLAKGAQRNGVQVRWVGRGAQAPDHPMLAEFPEGRYLKGWVGIT